MSKQMKLIIVLAGVLAVMFAAYIFLFTRNDTKEKDITLRTENAEDIASVIIENKGGTFSFERSAAGWKYLEDESFPVNPAFFESIEKGVTRVSAKRRVTGDPGERGKYGLDSPESTVTVKLKDGSEYTILVGDRNGTTSDYYISCDGEDGIYTAKDAYAGRFCRTVLDMASRSPVPDIDISHVRRIGVERDGESFSEKYEEDGLKVSYSPNVHWYMVRDDTYFTSEDRLAKELKDAIVGISLKKCVAYKLTPDQKEEYGFNGPSVKLTMDYAVNGEPRETVVVIGKEDVFENDDGTGTEGSYVYFEKEDIAYTALNSDIGYLLGLTPESLRSTKVSKVEFGEIEGMDMGTSKEEHKVVFSRSTEKDLQGDDMTVVSYDVDGKRLDDDSIWDITYTVNSMRADGFPEEDTEIPAEPDAFVIFYRNTESSVTVPVEYYRYDNNFYLAVTDNAEKFLVNRKDVETLIDRIESY